MEMQGDTPIEPLPDDFLAANSPAIDAEEIMAELRRRIEQRQRAGLYRGIPRLALDAPPPPGAPRRIEESLAVLQMYSRYALEGAPISSHRRWIGWWIVAWKRFTRFWVCRYTDPIFIQQHLFNEEAVALLRDIHEQLGSLRREIEDLRRRP